MTENEANTSHTMEPIRISTTIVPGPNRRILASTRDHELVMDIRKERGGNDSGPTPPECLAMALGGCILNLCRLLAMQKGIALEDLRISVSGEIDPSRAHGIATAVRAGFSHLSVQVEAGSKLSDVEREKFCGELLARCPLCDTIGNRTPLEVVFTG